MTELRQSAVPNVTEWMRLVTPGKNGERYFYATLIRWPQPLWLWHSYSRIWNEFQKELMRDQMEEARKEFERNKQDNEKNISLGVS